MSEYCTYRCDDIACALCIFAVKFYVLFFFSQGPHVIKSLCTALAIKRVSYIRSNIEAQKSLHNINKMHLVQTFVEF